MGVTVSLQKTKSLVFTQPQQIPEGFCKNQQLLVYSLFLQQSYNIISISEFELLGQTNDNLVQSNS